MRVLALSKYDRLAASPRHRFLAYAPALARAGVELELSPLFDDDYLASKFARGKSSKRAVLRAYVRRLVAILQSRRWDLLWVHCELFPYLPAWAEVALSKLGVPYVFDYDDAIFHMYDQHPRAPVRAVLGDKIGRVIAPARAVTAGSQYLADYAGRYNDRVHVVPTVVDLERYAVREERPAGPFTVGWIGSPSTSVYLDLVAGALEEVAKEAPLRLILVGSPPRTIPGVEVDVREWSEAREVQDLLDCDVGIMPLPDEPWARGKCAFKLIQYMACGLPTICSPVGANLEVVDETTGMLATSTAEWTDALRRLRDDAKMRATLGGSGRERIEERYSLQSQEQRVLEILRSAV
jgi:glycosyltransferase involved in cell wall biosynthesis